MSDVDRARDMFTMAEKDLAALQGMGNNPQFAIEIFGFHAQQAVEKALKAWIVSWVHDYPLTHNIIILLTALEEAGADVGGFWNLARFNTFAVQFRYEPADELDVELDRNEVIRDVTRLIDHVRMVIGNTTM